MYKLPCSSIARSITALTAVVASSAGGVSLRFADEGDLHINLPNEWSEVTLQHGTDEPAFGK